MNEVTQRSRRSDDILRVVIVLLVAAVLGLAALFGYRVWADRQVEATATPSQRAIQGLEKAVRADPDQAALRVRLGEAYASAGMNDQAVEQFQAAVKLDPKHTGAFLDLGIVAMGDEDRAAAEKYFEKVIELTTGSQYEAVNQRREVALFHLGEISLDAKRYEDAASYFKDSLRIRRDASDTYYLLAQTYRGLGEDDAAIKQLENALVFDPNYAEAHYLYGVIMLDRKDRINAAEHLRLASELAPDVDLPKKELAKLGTASEAVARAQEELDAGRAKKAVDEALLAQMLDPKNVDAYVTHARALIELDKTKAAIKSLETAKKIDPKNAEAIALLGELKAN